jgi:endo-1,4-beta-xylanase
MKNRQFMGLVVFLTLLYEAYPSGFAQQARPPAAMTAKNTQPPAVTPGPPPEEFVPNPVEHPTVVLWPNGAPGSEKNMGNKESYRMEKSSGSYTNDILVVSQVHSPSLTVFLPAKKIATGAAIIVAPGGGFRELWITGEGYRVAAWLSQQGIAAFVLKYRLPKDTGSTYTMDDSLADMQRAIRTVKSRATEWEVDPNRVGIMGFSAGSQLSGIAGQRFDDPVTKPVDAIDQLSARPAFEALIYGSPFTSTQGEKPLVEGVRKDTPPTFLACGANDPISAKYPQTYQMLKDAGVPVELHIYGGIGHGFGIQPGNPRSISQWPDRLYDWLVDSGFLIKTE